MNNEGNYWESGPMDTVIDTIEPVATFASTAGVWLTTSPAQFAIVPDGMPGSHSLNS